MENQKLSFGMPRHNPVTGFQQLGIAGKIVIVERPVRMVIKFFVAFVEAVSRCEKCNGVRDVNSDWHLELPASVPHSIESTIVNFHQPTGGNVLSQIESKSFQNFQPSCTVAMGLRYCLGLNSRVSRFSKSRVRRFGERIKAPGKS